MPRRVDPARYISQQLARSRGVGPKELIDHENVHWTHSAPKTRNQWESKGSNASRQAVLPQETS